MPSAAAVEAGFCDEIDPALARAKAVSAAVLKFRHVPLEIAAMAKGAQGSGRTQAQRARLRRRLEIIAAQVRSRRDPVRDEEDRERGARQRRRWEMQAKVEEVKADARKEDAQERAAIKERQRRDYFYNWLNVPHGQRK